MSSKNLTDIGASPDEALINFPYETENKKAASFCYEKPNAAAEVGVR
jgi:hypothetical protein